MRSHPTPTLTFLHIPTEGLAWKCTPSVVGVSGATLPSLVACLCLALTPPAEDLVAQTRPEPVLESLREAVSSEALTLGLLLQTVVDPSVDGSDPEPAHVTVPAMRVLLWGSLDGGFDYFFQANLAASPAILDARAGWTFSERLGVWAGRFKAPLSQELLTYAGDLDFVERARVVRRLAPNRQMGVQLHGRAAPGVDWSLGGFTGPDNSPSNDALAGVARVAVTPSLDRRDTELLVAASAAVGRDEAIAGRILGPGFEGDGYVLGADLRLTSGRLLLAGEGIVGDYDPAGPADTDAGGLYLTAGWMTTDETQLLVRWDRYRPTGGSSSDDALVLGFNAWPTSAARIRVNWVAPLGDSPEAHKLLLGLQIGF